MILTILFATVLPCSLSPGLMLDLADARQMAETFGVPTPIAVFPDPHFGEDHPIVIEIVPNGNPRRKSLVFTTTHTQALALPDAMQVTDNQIVDLIEITTRGFVLGGGTCEARRGEAEAAINALLRPE